ncbi:DUF1289 domain-containing protein [Aquabacterium sp.]|uniref:DUF1289 domain-containing protein n=1 Tax=Aquabacterium sp. TaxID=1872578 RepID=UPI002C118B3C|nr:DUF1289 domain-containing protein [Aquabacterium sp.]HSW05463.1 DUF1289 domain-containing protein [Aquabacterium sp.]
MTAGVASPCINVCRMHAGSGWCEGCLRTIDEIAAWSQLDDPAKRQVLALVRDRRRQWRLLRAEAAAVAVATDTPPPAQG